LEGDVHVLAVVKDILGSKVLLIPYLAILPHKYYERHRTLALEQKLMSSPAIAIRKSVLPLKRDVVILEDNPFVLRYISDELSDKYSLRLFSDENSFLRELINARDPDVVVMQWKGAERSADLVSQVLARRPGLPVVLSVSSADPEDILFATNLGVRSLLMRPFDAHNLDVALHDLLSNPLGDENEAVETPLGDNSSFVRSGRRMRDIEAQAKLVAQSDIPVLILGESGTGKEVLAKYTHAMSRRSDKMFLKVNCAAMPADLLESELFGYEQGAFTGAVKTKPGKFEICNGGTIFLDEIGEMPAILQAKLLHVLQDGTFSRLGSRAPMKADVRVVAATNIDMREAMARKTFREDLYYRLNGFSFTLPPLRERREEISMFATFFMKKGAQKYNREPLPLSTHLLNALEQYSWPGNLRELENVINRYLVIGDEASILSELSSRKPNLLPEGTAGDVQGSGGLKQLVRSLKGDAEASAIANALEETRWNRKAAAAKMQISYKALLYKIKQYELAKR
jgi:DNA-binding NtrC family response regulator